MDGIRIGRSIRALRLRRDWRQVDLGDRCGLSQSEISRIELGVLEGIPVATLERVVRALGGSLDVRVRWNGEGLDQLLDAAHAAAVEATVRLLEACGWTVVPEVTFAIRGERGSIDVLAWRSVVGDLRSAAGDLLVVEVKSVVPDLQAMLATLDRKVRLGPVIARDRGLPGVVRVSRLLVVSESTTSRRRVEQHGAMLAAALPTRGRAVLGWLRSPPNGVAPMAGLIFLPSTRGPGTTRRQRVRSGRRTQSSRSRSPLRAG